MTESSAQLEHIQGDLAQWHPTPVLSPGESHGWRSLVGCSPWGREESDMTERLHFHFSLSCIGEGNGNALQCSCLENPRDGGAWWAAVYGVAESPTWLKRLSSSSTSGNHSVQGELQARRDPGLTEGQRACLCVVCTLSALLVNTLASAFFFGPGVPGLSGWFFCFVFIAGCLSEQKALCSHISNKSTKVSLIQTVPWWMRRGSSEMGK